MFRKDKKKRKHILLIVYNEDVNFSNVIILVKFVINQRYTWYNDKSYNQITLFTSVI